jgi:nitroreductase/dihydropteridine reductase
MDFKKIVKTRYATKSFNGKQLLENQISDLLEIVKYSASSFGLQPYKIVVVSDKEKKEKLQEASWNQPQVGSSSHVLVFCAYPDYEKRIGQYDEMIGKSAPDYIKMMRDMLGSKDEQAILSWATNQTYLAVGNALNGAKSLGFDSCPMEGFDPKAASEILNLPAELKPVVLVPVGIANDEPRAKVRYSDEELFIQQ